MKIKLQRYKFSHPVDGGGSSWSRPSTPEAVHEELARSFDRVAAREIQAQPAGLAALLATTHASDATARGYDEDELDGVPGAVCSLALGFRSPFLPRFVRRGMRVLDVGCGAGVDLHLAARAVGRTGRVAGLDLSPRMVQLARDNAPRRAGSSFHEGIAEALPFDDGAYDAVMMNCCLGLVPDRSAALAEAARVLDDDGILLLTDLVTLRSLDADLLEALSGWGSGVGTAPPRVELRRDLEGAGFKPVDIEEHIFDRARLQTMAMVVSPGVSLPALRKSIAPVVKRLSGRLAVLYVAARLA